MAPVTFRDEIATGKALAEFTLPDLPERISARELVRLRVRVVSFGKLVPLVGG
ncbi:hypothetical protein [Streptosporangium subroseum]|uniref:hypothetical protein n=1 Tax=Streptosporangium subroseum TaxID=106412 RepID=UPI0030902FF3|nr:hypothetical protein OHB15_18905 [Streptosporangium subroseum]